MIKAQISGRMVSSGISDLAFASVIDSATTLSDYDDDEEPQEFPVFVGWQKWTSSVLLDPEM